MTATGPKECPNNMDTLPKIDVIGIDVSRDWLDSYTLSCGGHRRLPNTAKGHQAVIALAKDHGAIVCFESTGGLEWLLWQVLATAGVAARQVLPAQGEPLVRLHVICATGPSNHWRRFERNGERLRQKPRDVGEDGSRRCSVDRPLLGFPARCRAGSSD